MKITTWNTGSRYTAKGQRIAALELDGSIYFHDADRMISGKFVSEPGFSIKDLVRLMYLDGPQHDKATDTYTARFEHWGVPSEIERALRDAALAI